MKKKKAAAKGKVKKSRKRSATKDLSAKKAGSVKGGALVDDFSQAPTAYKLNTLSDIKIAPTGSTGIRSYLK